MRTSLRLFSRARLAAPRVEPVGWRPEEWEARKESGDPFVEVLEREAVEISQKR